MNNRDQKTPRSLRRCLVARRAAVKMKIKTKEVEADTKMLEFIKHLRKLAADARKKHISKKQITACFAVMTDEYCPKDWR